MDEWRNKGEEANKILQDATEAKKAVQVVLKISLLLVAVFYLSGGENVIGKSSPVLGGGEGDQC